MKHLVIAGGSGFLGQTLTDYFVQKDWKVTILTRSDSRPVHGAVSVRWDGVSRGDWERALMGADALINLAGYTVNCRYHAANRRRMMDSRVQSTQVLGEALAGMKAPPAVWIQSSTATIYRHNHGPAWDEQGEIGSHPEAKDAFSIEVATAWEKAFVECELASVRKVAIRSSMVMGAGGQHNNVFRVLRRLARFGLGGRMGHGRQFVSWIHERDFCRAIEWLVEHPSVEGTVNVCSPNPVANAEMMRLFRKHCGRSIGLPAARWMLEVGAFLLRTETELIVKSRRVIPGRLMKAGFQFDFPELDDAVGDLMARCG